MEAMLKLIKKDKIESGITEKVIYKHADEDSKRKIIYANASSSSETEEFRNFKNHSSSDAPLGAHEITRECADGFKILLNTNREILNSFKCHSLIINDMQDASHNQCVNKDTVTFTKLYPDLQTHTFYYNNELEVLNTYNSQFVETEVKGLIIKQHPLYELLVNYLQVCEKITANSLELEQIRKEYKSVLSEIWRSEDCTLEKSGKCKDGRTVKACVIYNKTIFQKIAFERVVTILDNVQKLANEKFVFYAYSVGKLKLQIDLHVHTVINNCIRVTQLNDDAPVALVLQDEPPHLSPYFSEIRICISILFSFQRKLIREKKFINETRTWLTKLVAVLLRVANFHDHLFIVNHILRCSSGVGSWASSFVQTPLDLNDQVSPFTNYQINHILTVLDVILSPIKDRQKFFEDIAQNGEIGTSRIDSIEDQNLEFDTSLGENDLMALVNQLPWENLFRNLLLIYSNNLQDGHDSALITEDHILSSIVFSTVLLKILCKGLQNYDQPKYIHFSKRLSLLLCDVTQYVTDQWDQFVKNQKHKSVMEQLQVEYDAFIIRSVWYLYSSQKQIAWQFLANIPYHMVTLKTLWKIFAFLHNLDSSLEDILEEDYSDQIFKDELNIEFEQKQETLQDPEAYYIFNTFATMALAGKDVDLTNACTNDLLKIGFLNEATRESCAKSATILLPHLTLKNSHLFSYILKQVTENIDNICLLALYDLYEELPLTLWKLTNADLEFISSLLLANSSTSKLARMILSRLNWDFQSYEIHCDVAILVVHAADLEPPVEQWAWQIIYRLKLHMSDRGGEVKKIQDVETYNILVKGIEEKNSLAIFVAILLTTWGHSILLICNKGFPQLLFLQSQQKFEAALFALYQIVPIFLNSQEYLIEDDKFREICMNLLNADGENFLTAESLASGKNTFLQQFGNMIETQILNFAHYGLQSGKSLVKLWISVLVSVSNWYKDTSIIYILDRIVRTVFSDVDVLKMISDILRSLLQETNLQVATEKSVSSVKTNNSLIHVPMSNYAWIAYILINVEYQEREVVSGLWNEVLIQLSKQEGKGNIENAIEKTVSVVTLPALLHTSLGIYRWKHLALVTPLDHPLLPLLWQKFLTLYLVQLPCKGRNRIFVGDKVFNDITLKKIKTRLQECVDYFQSKIENGDLNMIKSYSACHEIFQAFSLWLNEPIFKDNSVLIENFPAKYKPDLLSLALKGIEDPWYNYVNYNELSVNQKICFRTWQAAIFRERICFSQPVLNLNASIECKEQIMRRLAFYDKPKSPPCLDSFTPQQWIIDVSSNESMFKSLDNSFNVLKQFAQSYMSTSSNHKVLNRFYQEKIHLLYESISNKTQKKIPCYRNDKSLFCSGPADIILHSQESHMNELVEQQLEENRNSYENLLTYTLEPPPLTLLLASVTIEQTINILHTQLRCNPSTAESGVKLFYFILSLLNEETKAYLPTKTLFTTCLQKLGQLYICGVEREVPILLQMILKDQNLREYLIPHFCLNNLEPDKLLFIYSTICQEIEQKHDIAYPLLVKFEVKQWLQVKRPILLKRSELIKTIIKALIYLGFDPPAKESELHELYRKHLLAVFEYQFPEHYMEVMKHLLKATSGNLIAVSVWLDLLNCLAKPVVFNLRLPLRDQLIQYAQDQKILQLDELLQTSQLLSRQFTQERLQHGLHGFYPKYYNYMDVLVIYLGMIGHSIINKMPEIYQSDELCCKIWPFIRDMFFPWLVRQSTQNLNENMASWLEELSEHISILLPWRPVDGDFAQKIINVFYDCVNFMIHTVPAPNSILSYMWQWYVTYYAYVSNKDYIVIPIHKMFLTLPWDNFWPCTTDIEYMVKIVDHHLHGCYPFLGHIFMSISWPDWLHNISDASVQMTSHVYQSLLILIVKLFSDSYIKEKYPEKAKSFLVELETFNWAIIDPIVYQHVMDWIAMNYDANAICKDDPLDFDHRILYFLKYVSNYHKPPMEPTSDIMSKRLTFVKTYIKLLIRISRDENNIENKQQEFSLVILSQLNDLECVVTSEDEMTVLIKEYFSVLNISDINSVFLSTFTKWIENIPGNGIIVRCLLKTLAVVVTDLDTLSELFEITLNSYFCNIESDEFQPTWKEIAELLNVQESTHLDLEQAIINKSCILTLNAFIVQRISKSVENEALLNLCLEWMDKIKMNETTAPKVPLIWCSFIMLVLQHVDRNEPLCRTVLYKFADILQEYSENRLNSGWNRVRNTVLRRKNIPLRLRFCCRALAAYILAQLPEMVDNSLIIRSVANAPGVMGQPGGNTRCAKLLKVLNFSLLHGKIKSCAELALSQINDPNNSLHNTHSFIVLLVEQFYTQPYFKTYCLSVYSGL